MSKLRKGAAWLLMCMLIVSLFSQTVCALQTFDGDREQYAQARIGIMTGSSHERTVKDLFPEAQRVYFNNMSDMLLALEQEKIDCFVEDETFVYGAVWEGMEVGRLAEPVKQVSNGFAFSQSEDSRALREELNAFLEQAEADGTLTKLRQKWLGDTQPQEHPDITALTGENGTLSLAIVVESKPLIYLYNEKYTGLEIEVLTLFGQACGYAFDIKQVPFDAVIAGISAGKYDLAAAGMNITAEREESVDFSVPYGTFDVGVFLKGAQGDPQLPELSDLENAVFGVISGSIYADVLAERFPDAQVLYFPSHADMIVSLEQGKIDAFAEDDTIYTAMCWDDIPVTALDETLIRNNTALAMSGDSYDPELLAQFNAFIARSGQDGTILRLEEKWLSESEPDEHPDYSDLTGENGTLKVAVAPSIRPMTYRKGEAYSGYEIELLTLFAREHGYRLEIEGMSFDALLSAVTSGKYDIAAACITITPERTQSVTFSDPYLHPEGRLIVSAQKTGQSGGGWFDSIRDSFEKTFIRENRWKLLLEGVGVTALISVCSAFFGTVLGFGLYLLSRSQRRAVAAAAVWVGRIHSRIVAGTPVVVILMILFYVVFAGFRDISGIPVAIVGFSLTFGAFVYDHMTVSVNSVNYGQTEAALALGYTPGRTFFRIIFPQAMTIFLPSYCGQIVDLVKATAVVGYIAVNDLTKMGDIIRSNTYEAFMPLMITAAIYFLLTWALSLLLGLVKLRFEPKRRSREDILKGVRAE